MKHARAPGLRQPCPADASETRWRSGRSAAAAVRPWASTDKPTVRYVVSGIVDVFGRSRLLHDGKRRPSLAWRDLTSGRGDEFSLLIGAPTGRDGTERVPKTCPQITCSAVAVPVVPHVEVPLLLGVARRASTPSMTRRCSMRSIQAKTPVLRGVRALSRTRTADPLLTMNVRRGPIHAGFGSTVRLCASRWSPRVVAFLTFVRPWCDLG
jgi:hypothetical protein